jgi:DUF971 family protein
VSKPTEVVSVDIDKEASMRLEFDDGVTAVFDLVDLRTACPCAGCRGDRDRGRAPWPQPGQPANISVREAELVGAWGISITWSDGHEAGIYPWDRLRQWHDANTAGLSVEAGQELTDTVDPS